MTNDQRMSNDEAPRTGAKTQSGNAPADRVWALSIGHWKLVIFLAALVVGLGMYLWYRPRLPEPPAPNLQEIDPAIVAVVEEAREAVLRSPRSASAWGHLGKVLAAHEFATE